MTSVDPTAARTASTGPAAVAREESLERAFIDAFGSHADLLVLAERFRASGHALALVGGCVRDVLLPAGWSGDLDLTTDARPDQIARLLSGWAEAIWEIGAAFGTVGARRGGQTYEVTTYRSDVYRGDSRKPQVVFGSDLICDLSRRDFTVNAMAVRLPDLALVDPFGGVRDLHEGWLRTPIEPEVSFADDPLRMMRAARFVSQLGLRARTEVSEAMTSMADRIGIVSAERVGEEFRRLLLGRDPRSGLALLVTTGLAERVIPELPALRLHTDEHLRHKDIYEHTLTVLEQAIERETDHFPVSGPDLTLRLAALLHDIAKPATRRVEADGSVTFHHHEVVGSRMARRRLQALRYPTALIDDVCLLIELHLRFHGYREGAWTDSAVRRYVRDAGDQLIRLHKLTRADCTTRNARKAARLRAAYDELERRIDILATVEEMNAIRPDLDGRQIMEILGVPPGPIVGRAYRHLLDLRLERGPLPATEVTAALLQWWGEQPEAPAPGTPG